MKPMNVLLTTSLLTVLSWPAAGLAARYECQQGSLTRIISVQHPADSQLPCEVRYEKPDEGGEASTPWRAQSTPGYCRDKAGYLADRLRSFGWQCTFTESEPDGESSAAN